MKKFFLLFFVTFVALHLSATPVDLVAAKTKAKQCVTTQIGAGKFLASSTCEPTLVHTQMGKQNTNQTVYYIFNTDFSFVVVAGDDRAEEILAIGDRPLNVDHMPENMKALLNSYSEQIDFLLSNPDIHVKKPFKANVTLNALTIEPLLTALWDQHEPYYNQCVFDDYQCLTGCPATSASMVYYYWKYPVEPTAIVPSYSFDLKYSVWELPATVNVPELPSVTFDWGNMLDNYLGNYTPEQGSAVATLMRYIGQAERMVYGTPDLNGSGLPSDSVNNIAEAFIFFGYDESTVRTVKKISSMYNGQTLYSDEEWATMIQDELIEERPIVFTADSFSGGHAFNVDGYDAATNLYHVNFGWSGNGNGNFALNAFSDGSAMYNNYQQMIIGIQPQTPAVLTSTQRIHLECFTGETVSQTFTLTGRDLTDNVTITIDDENGVFSTDVATVALSDAEEGKEVTVTFAPQTHGKFNATITLTSADARKAVVRLNATSSLSKENPVALEATDIHSTSFRAVWTHETPVSNVASYSLEVQQVGNEMAEEVATADFSSLNYTGMQADEFDDYDSYCSPNGWTGTTVYPDKGGVRLGYSSDQPVGTLITPPLDFTQSGGKLTITFKAKGYGGGTGNASLVINTSSHEVSQSLKSTAKTYTVVLDCDEFNNETVTFTSDNKRVFLTDVTITTTDLTTATAKSPIEQGDAVSRTITGITDKNYVVTGLTHGASYCYRVKALYVDDDQSPWSSCIKVELPLDDVLQGDVNGDGSVTSADVTAIYDYLLNGESTYESTSDVNGDGHITSSDITLIYNILLGNE